VPSAGVPGAADKRYSLGHTLSVNADTSVLWQSWSAEIVMVEVNSFQEEAQALTGLSEEVLLRQLGAPGETVPGTRIEDSRGNLVVHAEYDFRYFNLLAHTVVHFLIAKGVVARVSYFPKWQQCPPEFASTLIGNIYAPV
jgi:hypothetical protein